MPCNGGNYFGSHTRVVSDPEDRRKIDHLTRLLCHLAWLADDAGVELPAEIDEWWYEHKLEDAERVAEAKRRAARQPAVRRFAYLESVKKRVMSQLTDDERESLGLRRRHDR